GEVAESECAAKNRAIFSLRSGSQNDVNATREGRPALDNIGHGIQSAAVHLGLRRAQQPRWLSRRRIDHTSI
ncbi:hypothetical protein LRR18_17745, partial [Mangrovimonas sp. AS39]|uniref:hypothetical protein n=1 Tax=Mangrovimonas futianensis TaxID=2895523 RepID=UPI001E480AE4